MLERLDQVVIDVQTATDLERADALVLPGGKSPALAQATIEAGLWAPIKQFAGSGRPVLGTCAGLVLLAQATGRDQLLLGLLHVRVKRSAFSRDGSFDMAVAMPALGTLPFRGVFRAAPAVAAVGGGVAVLATLDDGTIVAVRQGNLLATAFHPELTDDLRLHAYFLTMGLEDHEPATSEAGSCSA
jgi:5'-phosphate synthase pdxT subunit